MIGLGFFFCMLVLGATLFVATRQTKWRWNVRKERREQRVMMLGIISTARKVMEMMATPLNEPTEGCDCDRCQRIRKRAKITNSTIDDFLGRK